MTKTREMDSEMIEKTPIRGWLLPEGALLLLLLVGTPPCVAADEPAVEKPAVPKTIVVRPAEVDLVGRRGVARLSVLGRADGGRVTDLSRVAKYKIENPGVVAVTADGRLSAVGNGQSRVTVAFGGQSQTITVRVKDFGVPDPVDFHGGDCRPVPRRLQPGCLSRVAPGEERVPVEPAGIQARTGSDDVDPRDLRASDESPES